MKKLIFLLLIFNTLGYTQKKYSDVYNNKPIIRTSVIYQSWKLDKIDSTINETSIPIEIIVPIRENINLQIYNSPAFSSFGKYELSGISDTWIKGVYSFYNKKMMVSCGIGLPTGKAELNGNNAEMASVLSQNIFKFRMPVLGQGLSGSIGYGVAHALSQKVAIGVGFNYIFQGEYKFLDYNFNPGNQFGMNFGLDYSITPTLKVSFDVLSNFYSADKINVAKYKSDPKISSFMNIVYSRGNNVLWIIGCLRKTSRSETSFGTTVFPDSVNSNIVQMELEMFYRINFNQGVSMDLIFDGRSYIENEFGLGQADIFGGGIRSVIEISPNLKFNIMAKYYFGDAYFRKEGMILTTNGIELMLGTIYFF